MALIHINIQASNTEELHEILSGLLVKAREPQVGYAPTAAPPSHPYPVNVSETGGGAGQTAPAVVEEAVVVEQDVLDFLNNDSRYEMRSFTAVAEEFPSVGRERLDELLSNLVNAGKVQTKRRRNDGVTLYKAVAFAAGFTGSAVFHDDDDGPTYTEVIDFIDSDSRYSSRSGDAIVKHFSGEHSPAATNEVLKEMVEDGELETLRRRRDGATLYAVA